MKLQIIITVCLFFCITAANGQFGNAGNALGGNADPQSQARGDAASTPVSFIPNVDAKQIDFDNPESALAIIIAYVNLNDTSVKTLDNLKDYFNENPNNFLSEEVSTLKANIGKSKETISATGGVLGEKFGGTAFVDGLGTFLADRFKEELTIKYLEKFKQELTTDSVAQEFKKVFPNTIDVLLINDVFRFNEFINTLREAFKEDINNLPSNIPDLLLEKNSDPRNLKFFFLADFVKSITMDGEHPLNIIAKIENNEIIKRALKETDSIDGEREFYSSLRLSRILIESVKNDNGKTLNSSDALFRRDKTLRYFLGLLIEKEREVLKTISFGGEDTAVDFLNGDVEEATSLVRAVRTKVQTIEESVTELKNELKRSKELPFGEIDKILVAFSEIIYLYQDLMEGDGTEIEKKFLEIRKAVVLVGEFMKLTKFVKEEKYGLALNQSIRLMDSLKVSQESGFYKSYKKYGQFIVNVAQAENSTQVKEAIKVAALPVGSYRIKRNTKTNISLNSYVGFFGGFEFLSKKGDLQALPVEGTSLLAGMTAPIGLAFSWGGSWEESKPGNSFTVMISLLDVGAVTSFRLRNDEAEQLPEVKLANFIAPGVHLIHGIKDSPLSVGIAGQYGPQIRNIADFEEEDLISSYSIKLFLAVDIPLINFYTKAK